MKRNLGPKSGPRKYKQYLSQSCLLLPKRTKARQEVLQKGGDTASGRAGSALHNSTRPGFH